MTLALGLLLIALLAALGMPLFAVIAAIALLGFHLADYDLIVVTVEIYRLGDMPGLIAIPLFTLAGYLLGESRAPKRLVRLSNALLGWLPGGLAIVAIVACAFFTAFTGASGVTIVALGALLYPALRQAGFDDGAIVEILAHVALNLFTNYVNVALDVPLDFPAVKLRKAA